MMKYNSDTKEATRACHKKLMNTKVEPIEDLDDFFFIRGECGLLFEDMAKTVQEERHEENIHQALTAEYERIRVASFEKRKFRLRDIQSMMHTMDVHNLSSPFNSKSIAGRGPAMQTGGWVRW